MAKTQHIIVTLVISGLLVLALAAYADWRSGTDELILDDETSEFAGPYTAAEQEIYNPTISNSMNPVAVFTTNRGVIELELFADQMPVTTGNFIKLAEEGFYDQTKFHRVIDGFMIQGGDPNSKSAVNDGSWGTGGPGYTIADEFVAGEGLSNTRGTIAMANTGQPNSGGSQWFINLVDNTNLDFDKEPFSSKHPVFGRVIAGMEVVDAIGSTETGPRDVPVDAVVIESLTIRRN